MSLDLIRPDGAFLYKYGSSRFLDRLQDVFLRHRVYFSSPSEFQDPLDARPAFKPLSRRQTCRFFVHDWGRRHPEASLMDVARELGRVGTIVANNDQWVRDEFRRLFHAEMEQHRIYCLTTRSDNEHLWAEYAGNETGYCLEFRTDGAPFNRAHFVQYGSEVELDVLAPGAQFLWQKTEKYRPEEEVRILALPRGSPKLISFEPRLLSAVILGRRMTAEHRATVKRWARRRKPTALTVRER